ncbi:lymphocyte antigen-6, epidermis [Triplophysa rosa]|uniref:Ly-6/neurotoxin-like protein 1 n=1 Tax=Triplophysa rosa TaxID=992332 RepID=A0A9W7TLM0_TRIRA|nr:lymphocyte antigen-6, epidermis [Triplophysa rosa]KAI7799109.1 putative ly-6/neurotoxin-like protein 1 [Triplophysa rosa]
MNRIVFGVVAVVALFTLSEALKCNTCQVGILGKCFLKSEATCAAPDTSCFTAKAEFNVTGFLSLSTSGCTSNCNNTAGTVLGAGYTITKTCCTVDLCNGASAAHMSVAGAVSAALLATFWSTYM